MKPKSHNANEKVKSFIDMAIKEEISWNSLESLLEDFSQDLKSSKQIIKILSIELKNLLTKLKEGIQNDGEIDSECIVDAKEVLIQVSDSGNNSVESVSESRTMKPDSITVVINDDVDLQIEEPQMNSDAFQLEEAVSLQSVESEENIAIENKVKPKILDADQDEIKVRNGFNSEDGDMPNENESHEVSVDVGLKKELLTYLSGSVENHSDNKWYTFVGEENAESMTDVQISSLEDQEEQKTFESLEMIAKPTEIQISNSKSFQCKICTKIFTVRKNLTRHMKIHSGLKPYHCNTCSKCFNNSKTLKNHEKVHTQEKPFVCKTCFKRFKFNNHLSRHEVTHSGEKPFKCDVCSKCYKYSNDLKIHRRCHTSEKPFQCKSCQKAFSESSTLKEHMKLHTIERETYQCKICSKSFHYAKTLQRHLIIHSGERPFQCNTCSKSFTQSQHLTRHQNIHLSKK